MSRHKAREEAFKLIFEATFKKDELPGELIAGYYEQENLSELADERAYFETIVKGVLGKINELNNKIEQLAIGWKINRISRVSSTLLKIAIFEIDSLDYVPHRVSVNEAIELAKKYDSPEAASFINGILGSYIRKKDKDSTVNG